MSTEEPMSIEERVRTATRARASLVTDIRPLAEPGRVRPRRPVPAPRRWPSWGIPLVAAAAVVVLALSLVAIRSSTTGSPTARKTGTATGQAAVPRYYAALNYNDKNAIYAGPLFVGDDRTGKVIDTISPPSGLHFDSVQGSSDDRTFVVMASPQAASVVPPHTWFLLRIAPGTGRPYQLTELPIKLPDNAPVGFSYALSPDGRELAVESEPMTATTRHIVTLGIYSVPSGALLRAWTTHTFIMSGPGQDTLSWLADGRQLAFSAFKAGPNLSTPYLQYQLRSLNVTGPGTDLLAASRVVLTVKSPVSSPSNCVTLHLTPDGGTVICGTQYAFLDGGPGTRAGCANGGLKYIAYSAATGQPVRVLYQYRGSCSNGESFVLWTDDSALHVIGAIEIDLAHEGTQTARLGVITDGHFKPLKFPKNLSPDNYGTFAF